MATVVGPTQGAERHADAVNRWRARPRLALALRVAIFVLPIVISIVFTWGLGRMLPPERLGIGRWTWILGVFVVANVLLAGLQKLAARLLPLVALMKLTLVFPDQAPSRTKSTLRRSNSRKLLRQIKEAQERGEQSEEIAFGDYLVLLLRELNDHDRLTRGHSERVRVYAEMMGEELRLSDDDMNKLRWSALLHDVGKLSVPSEILNKPGRPTDDEWKILSGHPAAAREMLEPLRPWLGDWLHSADQHHCRWDGKGYPDKISGSQISLAGRLVAVADAYDVMTSARSYKKPLSVELARQELTECAGSQFDPAMVRAFLGISLGRLRTVAGPLAWLINLTGTAQLPAPIAGTVTSTAWSATAAAAGVVTASAAALLSPNAEPDLLAFAEPVVELGEIDVNVPPGGGPATIDVTLRTTEGIPTVSVTIPDGGDVEISQRPTRSSADGEWTAILTYTPDPDHKGPDGFEIEACVGDVCADGVVSIDPPDSNEAPVALDDSVSTSEATAISIDVLSNDSDVEGPVSLASVAPAANGTTEVAGSVVTYTPDAEFTGTDTFRYVIVDDAGAEASAVVTVEVVSSAWTPPVAVDDAGASFRVLEDDVVITGDVLANDDIGDDPNPTLELTLPPAHGSVRPIGQGQFEYTPDPNVNGEDTFGYRLIDSRGRASEATVSIEIDPVNDAPISETDQGIGFTTSEDTPFTTASVLDNDRDPDGELALTGAYLTIVEPPTNGTLAASGGGTFTYTPEPDFFGTDRFTYVLTDTDGLESGVSEVLIAVSPVPDAPVASDDTFSVAEDTTLANADPLANDRDPDVRAGPQSLTDSGPAAGGAEVLGMLLAGMTGSEATLSVVDGPFQGTVTINDDATFDYVPNADFHGTDSFTYTVADGDGLVSEPARVEVSVEAVNDAPTANSDGTYVTDQDRPLLIGDLVANDTDLEDDVLDQRRVAVVADATNGVVAHDEQTGFVTYTPHPGFVGLDEFIYLVRDSEGLESAPAFVTIDVRPSVPDNDAPVALDDNGPLYNTTEDTPFTTPDVTANDTDAEDGGIDPSTVTIVGRVPSTLGVAHNGDGTFDVTPPQDFFGEATIAYTVVDSEGIVSDPARVTVNVAPVNDSPVAMPDGGAGFETTEDTPFVTGDLTLNDVDVEDGSIDPSSVSLAVAPTKGTATSQGDGTFLYVPFPNETGNDSFAYQVLDSDGAPSAVTAVSILISAVNDVPVANNDAFVGTEDTDLSGLDLASNDSDVEDGSIGPQTITIATSPTSGALAQAPDGTWTYQPDPDFFGDDAFTYVVTDLDGEMSEPATVSLTIEPVNDAPVANDDSGMPFTGNEDESLITESVLANDTDPDSSLAPADITIVETVSNGVAQLLGDGSISYTPNADFNGTDSLVYTVADAGGETSDLAVVTFVIEPVNDPPVAAKDPRLGVEDTPLAITDLTLNDSDIEDGTIDPATVTLVDLPSLGELVQTAAGSFIYTPDPDVNGSDSFTYRVFDSDGAPSNVTRVDITITASNDAPVALSDAGPNFVTAEDTTFETGSVLSNDTDIEDGTIDPANLTVVADASNGVAIYLGDGRFAYTPDADYHGIDTIVYRVTDSNGTPSAPATVTIEVTPVNDAPIANDDSGLGFVTPEDVPISLDVLANDTDVEDGGPDPTTVRIVGAPASGDLDVNADGTLTFSPTPDMVGIVTFTYDVADLDGDYSEPALVTVEVTSDNDPPVAAPDALEIDEDGALNIAALTDNDSDVEDGVIDPLTIVIEDQPQNGQLFDNGDGTFTYNPDAHYFGPDGFTYHVSDSGLLLSNTATVTITVNSVNDRPVAEDDSGPLFETIEDVGFDTGDVTLNDYDIEDGPINPANVSLAQQAQSGSVTYLGDGIFSYVPAPDFEGNDWFTYTVTDSDGVQSVPATVSINVVADNDAPVAVNDTATTIEDLGIQVDVIANDYDLEDAQLDPSTIAFPPMTDQGGQLNHIGDGSFDYDPPTDFFGVDSFSYTITDSDGAVSAPARVSLVVTPVNDPPEAFDDSGPAFTVDEDMTLTTPSVLTNDIDVEDGVPSGIISIETDVASGTLLDTGGGTFQYEPEADYFGDVFFEYKVRDSDDAWSNVAKVTITINPSNDPPVANDDSYEVNEDAPGQVLLITSNDVDDEDPAISNSTISIDSSQTVGDVVQVNGTVTYTPLANWSGVDTFEYTISDSGALVSAPATVTITVLEDNDPPQVSTPQTMVTYAEEPFSLQIQGTDIEGDTLSYQMLGLPMGFIIDPDTGLISGQFDSSHADLTFTVSVDVTDDGQENGQPAGETTSIQFDIEVLMWGPSQVVGDIVINEVFFSDSVTPNRQFIELYNAGTTTIDLSGWRIANGNIRADGATSLDYVISPLDAFGRNPNLGEGEYATIWIARTDAPYLGAANLDFTVAASSPPLLAGGSDDLWLIDPAGRVHDYVAWGSVAGLGTLPPAELDLWNYDHNDALTPGPTVSISLTPNGVDTDTSACWEVTGSGDASTSPTANPNDARCPGVPWTRDNDNQGDLTSTYSANNNLFATAGGPYVIDEGEDLQLDASASIGGSTFVWDLHGGGDFEDATGVAPLITWAELETLGLGDDVVDHPIAVGIDGVTIAHTTLTIVNTPPVLSMSGAETTVGGATFQLSLESEDPGDDQIVEWIINWGDGYIESFPNNISTATHTYEGEGLTYNITAAARDEDGLWVQSELVIPGEDSNSAVWFAQTTADPAVVSPLASLTADHAMVAQVGPDGLIYVGTRDGRIVRFESDGSAMVDEFVSNGGPLDSVAGLAWWNGYLYVSDRGTGRVIRLDATSGLEDNGWQIAPTGFQPTDIQIRADGRLYVLDRGNSALEMFDAGSGAYIGPFTTGAPLDFEGVLSFTFGPEFNVGPDQHPNGPNAYPLGAPYLYVSSYEQSTVFRFTPAGNYELSMPMPALVNGLTGIEFGPEGALYIASDLNDEVHRGIGSLDVIVPASNNGGLERPGIFAFTPGHRVTVVSGPN